MIKFICDSWHDTKIITSDMIKKALKNTGTIYSPYQDKEVFLNGKK